MALKMRMVFAVCILTRAAIGAALVLLAHHGPSWVTAPAGGVLLVMAAGALANWGSQARTVGAFGQTIWWNDARLVHMAVWATAGTLLILNMATAGALVFVSLDPATGLIAYALLHQR